MLAVDIVSVINRFSLWHLLEQHLLLLKFTFTSSLQRDRSEKIVSDFQKTQVFIDAAALVEGHNIKGRIITEKILSE